ncbi:hypothetical protein E3N88_17200 [Mikania micrantha]|uniref:MraW methylase family protein n=1 Tax=Mikania micrantha TaxID=192012 RepID=A0A5N6NRQ2_9ASTR|nr:hypothetical protein E3N88_17200 [Mikania micrantha]
MYPARSNFSFKMLSCVFDANSMYWILQIIQAHPEMQLYVGLDCDPVAHEKAKTKIDLIQTMSSCDSPSNLKTHTFLRNFKNIRSTLCEVDEKLLVSGINGILMDLGMSSMQVNNANRGFSVLCDGPLDMRMDPQASLTAEEILNSWPGAEIGQILRDYGEENNWRALQKRIVEARFSGGLHSTGELVDLIKSCTFAGKGGRQGWIKTATRVFQALRIAVNDELKTLESSLYDCYRCLAPGGRLAVISFHSLEDRIVKQTFLNIINADSFDNNKRESLIPKSVDSRDVDLENYDDKEPWIKQMVHGVGGVILTKRPVTPSEDEEKLNTQNSWSVSEASNFRKSMRVFIFEASSMVFPEPYLPLQASCNRFCSRRRLRVFNCSSEKFTDSKVKKAKLSARKQERIKIPSYNIIDGEGRKLYPIREFLSHPSGIEALLNKHALQSVEQLDTTTYRCTLPSLTLLNFEVSPVIDLRVTPTDEDCMVEMLSCKFEGSEVMKQQNEHFSAEMSNYITWSTKTSEPYLAVDVNLDLTLEVASLFSLQSLYVTMRNELQINDCHSKLHVLTKKTQELCEFLPQISLHVPYALNFVLTLRFVDDT